MKRGAFFITIFALLYLTAVLSLGFGDLSLLISSLLLLALTPLVLVLTRRYGARDFPLRRPLLGLAVFLPCAALFWLGKALPLPQIGGEWKATTLLLKTAFWVLAPLLYLGLAERGFVRFAFSPKNLRADLRVALVMAAVISIPTFFYNPATWKPVVSGEISLLNVLAAFPISCVYYFFLAALPEEFFYRAFLQEHCAQLLKSRLSGLLLAALVFGYLHIPSLMRWYGVSFIEALIRATLVQTAFGLVFGIIWERTRSLVPLLILHTLIDAITNSVSVAYRLFG